MIHYQTTAKHSFAEVLVLYDAVAWTNYTSQAEMLEKAIANTLYTLYAYDDEELVGMLRAVGDGYSILFIQDILVLPAYQMQGIGRSLLSQCLGAFPKVYQTHLVTDKEEKTKAFYESLGFTAFDDLGIAAFTYIRK